MDGLTFLLLLSPPAQEIAIGLADFGVLAAAMVMTILSALALVRQVFFAITVRE